MKILDCFLLVIHYMKHLSSPKREEESVCERERWGREKEEMMHGKYVNDAYLITHTQSINTRTVTITRTIRILTPYNNNNNNNRVIIVLLVYTVNSIIASTTLCNKETSTCTCVCTFSLYSSSLLSPSLTH